jgi:glycerol-3-phosphate acyltransferase PlsY
VWESLTPEQASGGLFAFAYLLGSIPFGLLVARVYGKDIRELGSGNIGMTNVWRHLGWKPGLLVLILDVLKGFIPTWLALVWSASQVSQRFPDSTAEVNEMTVLAGSVWFGLGAVLGHTYTPWLKGKGGKGIATGLGVAIALFQAWILIPIAVFLVLLATTRMVSLSSLIAVLSLMAIRPFNVRTIM